MNLTHFKFDVDANGVATVLMDVEGQKMNTLSSKVGGELTQIIERLETDSTIKAVVFGSAKRGSFIAGADIDELKNITIASEASRLAADLQRGLSRLEALSHEKNKPVICGHRWPGPGRRFGSGTGVLDAHL